MHRVVDDLVRRNGTGTDTLFLPAIPAQVSEVKIDGVLLAATAYQVDETAGIIRRTDGWFPDGLGNVTVKYSHGWVEIPGDIQDAVLEHAATVALVQAHLQQNSAGSTQESYGAAALVGTTAKWTATVDRYKLGDR